MPVFHDPPFAYRLHTIAYPKWSMHTLNTTHTIHTMHTMHTKHTTKSDPTEERKKETKKERKKQRKKGGKKVEREIIMTSSKWTSEVVQVHAPDHATGVSVILDPFCFVDDWGWVIKTNPHIVHVSIVRFGLIVKNLQIKHVYKDEKREKVRGFFVSKSL